MRPRLTYGSSALLLICTFLSCKKDRSSSGPIVQPPATVYVLGVQNGGVVYWRNGTINSLFSVTGLSYNFGPSSLAASGPSLIRSSPSTKTSL